MTEFNLSEKREGLKELLYDFKKGYDNITLNDVLLVIENQDKEFMRLLMKEILCWDMNEKIKQNEIIDKLAGDKLIKAKGGESKRR